jgi:hypothetical protein
VHIFSPDPRNKLPAALAAGSSTSYDIGSISEKKTCSGVKEKIFFFEYSL